MFYRSSQSAPEKEAIPLMDYVLNVVSLTYLVIFLSQILYFNTYVKRMTALYLIFK